MSEFSKEFLKSAKNRLEFVYMGSKKGKAAINPLYVVDAFKAGYNAPRDAKVKEGGKFSKGANAVGRLVLAKLVSGPMLNITLLGLPFIISVAHQANKNIAKCEEKKRIEAKHLKISTSVKKQVKSGNDKKNQLANMKDVSFGNLKSLNSAPFSNVFLPIYHGLISCGVSEPVARKVAESGQADNRNFGLSENDLDGIITFLEAYCEDH